MKATEHFSDELLNAYLDGELDDAEQVRLMDALNTDETLRRRICDLDRVRNMVLYAYRHVPAAATPSQPVRSTGTRRRLALAASVMLAVGMGAGWLAHQYIQSPQGLLTLAKHVELNNQRDISDTWRVLLHLTTDNPRRLNVVLDEAEALLEHHAQTNQPLQLQILANGAGLNLLRADTSAHGQRIRQLQERYKNLLFVACGTAIKRLQEEKKLDVHLLPDITITPSALGEVMRKQGEGWTYIKI